MTDAAGLYGKSLYDLAVEENLSEEITEEITEVKKIFDNNPDYIRLLLEPSVPKNERVKLLDDAFGGQIQPYLLNFLKILLEKGLLRELSGCCRKVRECYNKDHGITEAVVTSAVKLEDEQLAKLKEKLETMSGRIVFITQKVDTDVLGGIRVEMDGKLLDGTVKGRLNDIRRKVNETVL